MQTVKQKTKLGIRQQLECAFGSVQPVNVPPVSKRVHGIKTLLFYVYAFLPVLIKARKTGWRYSVNAFNSGASSQLSYS